MKLLPSIALLLYLMSPVVAYGEKDLTNIGPLTARCYQAFDSSSSQSSDELKSVINELDQQGLDTLEASIAKFIEVVVRTGILPEDIEHKPELQAVRNILTAKNISQVRDFITQANSKDSRQTTEAVIFDDAVNQKPAVGNNKVFIPLFHENSVIPFKTEEALAQHTKEIKRKEWWINLYKRLTVKTKNIDEQAVSRFISMLEEKIKLQEFGSAMQTLLEKDKLTDELNSVFSHVELSMMAIKSISAKIVFLESVLNSDIMATLGQSDDNAIESGFSTKELPVLGNKEIATARARSDDLKFLLKQETKTLLKAYPLYQGLMTHLNMIITSTQCGIQCKSAALTFVSQLDAYKLPKATTLETIQADLVSEFDSFVPVEAFDKDYTKLLRAVGESSVDFHKEIDRFANNPESQLRQLDFQISRQKKKLWKWVFTGAVATDIIEFTLSKLGVRLGAIRVPLLGQVSIPGIKYLYRGHQSDRGQDMHLGDLFTLKNDGTTIANKIDVLSKLALKDKEYLVSIWRKTELRGMVFDMITEIESSDKLSVQYELFLKKLMRAKESYLMLGDSKPSTPPGFFSSMKRNAALAISLAATFVYATGSLTTFIGNPDDLSFLPNLIDSLGIDYLQGGAQQVLDMINNWFSSLGNDGLGVSPGDLDGIIDGINIDDLDVDEYRE